MSENISWLDILSFIVNLITFGIALRMDLRQSRQLRQIKRKEDQIKKSLE
jgi:hypothetical protein